MCVALAHASSSSAGVSLVESNCRSGVYILSCKLAPGIVDGFIANGHRCGAISVGFAQICASCGISIALTIASSDRGPRLRWAKEGLDD